MRFLIGPAMVLVLGFVVACSDDDKPQPDTGTPDTGVDMMLPDGPVAELGTDMAQDMGQPDTAADQGGDAPDPCAPTGAGTGTAKGEVFIKTGAAVTCDANAATDCKGNLIVMVACVPNPANPAVFTPMGMTVVPNADVTNGQKVAYEVQNLPVGSWYTIAILDDDEVGTTGPTKGDLLNMDPWPPAVITAGNTTTVADIDLEARCGPPMCN